MTIKSRLRKLIKWIMKGERREYVEEYSPEPYLPADLVSKTRLRDHNNGMNFMVYNAIGGKVIQFSSYDLNTSRETATLYIVTDQENLGEEISQIITRETLTR